MTSVLRSGLIVLLRKTRCFLTINRPVVMLSMEEIDYEKACRIF
jgi:hypothetical protein